MPLNLKETPRAATKEITLPSAGYPYNKAIPGGTLLIQAFNWDVERLLFKGANVGKELTRYLEVVQQVAHLPKDFDASTLLEGDVQYILMEARSLSYGAEYSFQSRCIHCGEVEEVSISIPDNVPVNRYPADFEGTLNLPLDGNEITIRFITLREGMDAESLTRQRIAKKVVSKDDYEADLIVNRIISHIVAVNGGTPDSLDEVRRFWGNTMSSTARVELQEFINRCTPGINFRLTMSCPKCNEEYLTVLPINNQFFRSGRATVQPQLPRGVRIGVLGADERSEVPACAGKENLPQPAAGDGGTKGRSITQ